VGGVCLRDFGGTCHHEERLAHAYDSLPREHARGNRCSVRTHAKRDQREERGGEGRGRTERSRERKRVSQEYVYISSESKGMSETRNS